jgi:hypothetical protein
LQNLLEAMAQQAVMYPRPHKYWVDPRDPEVKKEPENVGELEIVPEPVNFPFYYQGSFQYED